MSIKARSVDLPHITITFAVAAKERDEKDGAFTRTYAVSKEVSRDFDRQRDLHGVELQGWLDRHGGLLDSTDGPAVINRYDDGSAEECYYLMGKLCREDKRYEDGTTREAYFSNVTYSAPQGWPARITSGRSNKPRGPN
jgi:hypothetical protein